MIMKSSLSAYPFRNVVAIFIAAVFAAALAGCAGAGVKTGQYVDDSTITAKVKTELLNAENLPVTKIHVETLHGTVKLSGFVTSETQKRRAEVIARDVEGVKGVDNGLMIQSN